MSYSRNKWKSQQGGARAAIERSKPGELKQAGRPGMEWSAAWRTGVAWAPNVIAGAAQFRLNRCPACSSLEAVTMRCPFLKWREKSGCTKSSKGDMAETSSASSPKAHARRASPRRFLSRRSAQAHPPLGLIPIWQWVIRI